MKLMDIQKRSRTRVILDQMESMCTHIWMYIYVWQSHVGINDYSVTYFNRPFPLTSKYVRNLWRHIWGTSKRSLGWILHCYKWGSGSCLKACYIPVCTHGKFTPADLLRYPRCDVTYSAFHSVLMGKVYCIAAFKVLYCWTSIPLRVGFIGVWILNESMKCSPTQNESSAIRHLNNLHFYTRLALWM